MLEWNGTAKRKLKQEKRVLVTEMNFTKKCQYSNKSQNNPEILCTSVVGPDVDRNKRDGWVRKGGWWEGPVNNCCVSVLALWNLVFGPNINYDRGTCYP